MNLRLQRRRWAVAAAACGLAVGLLVPLSPIVAQSDPQWTTFHDDQGTVVQYPRGVFASERADQNSGRVLATADGRAQLHILSLGNERNETPAQYLQRKFTRNRGRLTYDRVTPRFFALSVSHEGRILYRRCNFPIGGRVHCIDLQYPQNEKRAWDATVTRISRSLRPR